MSHRRIRVTQGLPPYSAVANTLPFNMSNMNDIKKEKDLEGLDDDVQHSPINNHDDVFGELSDSGPNYRNVRLFLIPLYECP